MEAKGSGCFANLIMTTGVFLIVLSSLVLRTQAATYIVGGRAGWSNGVDKWSQGKTFKGRDVLVFEYDTTKHHVVQVDKQAYESCSSPNKEIKAFKTGNDKVKLAKGPSYYICSNLEHCSAGMKVAVNAA